MKEFFKKNFTGIHIGSMLVFTILAILYWYLSGRTSTYFFKNNLVLVIIWGLLVGWITGDFMENARRR